MTTTYRRAHDVETIAAELIESVEDHKPLAEAQLVCVWRDKASKSKGKTVLAKARKISGLQAFIANAAAGLVDVDANEPFFVLEVAEDTWVLLDDNQRRALVDHELCHMVVGEDDDGEPVLALRGHDLEEFAAVVERHGFWKSDVARFGAEVAEQLTLAISDAATFTDDLDSGEDEEG